MNKILKSLVPAAISVLFALLIGSIVLLVSGLNPITAYKALFYGAFGTWQYFGDTLSRATPIIFTGLALSLSFKGGMFNIGAEGQLLAGAIAAALAGFLFPGLPWLIHVLIAVLFSVIASGIWGFIPGILKAKKGVHEVIATIMMNYLALNLGGFVVEALRDGEMAQTPKILESAVFPRLSQFFSVFEGSNVNVGFLLAIIMAFAMYFLLFKTVFGFEVTSMGLNQDAAEDGGVNIKKKTVVIMVMSAALAGLAGAERVLGVHHSYLSGISTNFGFEGIAVALLANNHPIGIIFSALLFGVLASGGMYMNLAADVPVDIIGIIQGLIILFAACNSAFNFIKTKKANKIKNSEVAK